MRRKNKKKKEPPHLYTPGAGRNVVSSPGEQRDGVVVQRLHVELGQVGLEGDAGVVLARGVLDPVILGLAHVVLPRLAELESLPARVLGGRLHRELLGEHVTQLGAVAVATAGNLKSRIN